MLKLSSKQLSSFLKVLIVALIAKFLMLILAFFLPSFGINLQPTPSYNSLYQRVTFDAMLNNTKLKVAKLKSTPVTSNSQVLSLTNMILKGIYGSKKGGFAMIVLKNAPKKIEIISVGESIQNYRLKNILHTSVVLEKMGKEYLLEMKIEKIKGSIKPIVKKVKTHNAEQEPQQAVTRNDIEYYASSPTQIWKDISIVEHKVNGKMQGFLVKGIRAKSKMANLGLKQGDILIRVNNVELTSYKDALKLYKNLYELDAIALVVIRNKQEKELTYEIY